MMPPPPTAEDLLRDLAADLADVERVGAARRNFSAAYRAAPAAIRRALAAEAEVARLRAVLAWLEDRVALQSELIAHLTERLEAFRVCPPATEG